jgi:hypothetical protein
MLLVANGTVRYEIEPLGTVAIPISQGYFDDPTSDFFAGWPLIPMYEPRLVPDLTRIVNRLIDRTGWSNRGLAEIVGTTHPTIQAIKRGRDPERKAGLAEALFNTAEVVEKISRLAHGNQSVIKAVLSNRGQDGQTPLRLLSEGEYAKAYLRALDLLNKPRATVGLLDVRQRRRPSQDVGLIFDDPDE